jgi:uncharacterized coiled-coil protein SlyX
LEKAARDCQAARSSCENELRECQAERFKDIETVANHLRELASTVQATDGSFVPPVEFTPEPMTIEEIERLAQVVRQRFDELETKLTHQIALARQAAADQHHATQADLATIQELTAGLGSQVADAESLRAQIDTLYQEREGERGAIRAKAQEIAELVRDFDASRITCDRCGRGFSDRFGREILTFHSEVRARIDALGEGAAP